MNITLLDLLQRIRQPVLAINYANSGCFRGKKSTLLEMLSKLFRGDVFFCCCKTVGTKDFVLPGSSLQSLEPGVRPRRLKTV